MHVRAVAQELYADTCGEFRRQRLVLKLAAADGLCRLTEQQGKRVLHFTNLTLQVGSLCLHRIVVGLCTLHAGLLYTSQLFLQLHDVPCFLRKGLHVVNNLQLLVKHHQRVIHVGDVGNQLGLHHELIVFRGEQRHLCAALYIEQVAKEVYAPACLHWQRICLCSLVAVPRRDYSLRRESE